MAPATLNTIIFFTNVTQQTKMGGSVCLRICIREMFRERVCVCVSQSATDTVVIACASICGDLMHARTDSLCYVCIYVFVCECAFLRRKYAESHSKKKQEGECVINMCDYVRVLCIFQVECFPLIVRC